MGRLGIEHVFRVLQQVLDELCHVLSPNSIVDRVAVTPGQYESPRLELGEVLRHRRNGALELLRDLADRALVVVQQNFKNAEAGAVGEQLRDLGGVLELFPTWAVRGWRGN